MNFFPELSDEQTDNENEPQFPIALYATADGWLLEEDVNLQQRLEQLDLSEKYQMQISELLAKSVPGSYIRLPQAVLVILGEKM